MGRVHPAPTGGADIRFIQALLGHESLETTQIYTRVSAAKLAEIHAATHPGVRLVCAMLDAALAAEGEDAEQVDEQCMPCGARCMTMGCYRHPMETAGKRQSRPRRQQERADSIPPNPQKTVMHPCVRCISEIMGPMLSIVAPPTIRKKILPVTVNARSAIACGL